MKAILKGVAEEKGSDGKVRSLSNKRTNKPSINELITSIPMFSLVSPSSAKKLRPLSAGLTAES
jgi:hypothetical protein